MTLTCLVLAGGLGTRMSSFTSSMPKIMIPVCGRPFLHHQLDLLEQQGFTRVVLSLGYLGSMVVEELISTPHSDFEIDYMFDGDAPLGTGGAVRLACSDFISDDFFFITYGDSYLLIDPKKLMETFDCDHYEAIMALYKNEQNLDVSNAKISESGTVLYKKNVSNPVAECLDYVDFGMSFVSRSSLLANIPSGKASDLAQYFEEVSFRNKLQGFVCPQRFYEIGSHAGRDALEQYLS